MDPLSKMPGPTSQGEGSRAGRVAPCSTGWGLTLGLSRILREFDVPLSLGAFIAGLVCRVPASCALWSVGVAEKGIRSKQACSGTVHPEANLCRLEKHLPPRPRLCRVPSPGVERCACCDNPAHRRSDPAGHSTRAQGLCGSGGRSSYGLWILPHFRAVLGSRNDPNTPNGWEHAM